MTLLVSQLLVSQAIAAAEQRQWRFEVRLNDSPIGYHHFNIARDGSVTTVNSEAEFKVRLLFITAYRYSHEYREVWKDNCLAELRARTDDNGEAFMVHGGKSEDGFIISSSQNRGTLRPCVMSFAYWNPAILDQDALINAQTGEFLPVDVQARGEESISVGERHLTARRFDLVAGDQRIVVWYGPSGEWLGLESEVSSGRTLRYVLTDWSDDDSTWVSVNPKWGGEDS